MDSTATSFFRILGWKVQGDIGPFTCYTSRRNKLVWYLSAPPKEVPTWLQLDNQHLFAEIGRLWRSFTPATRKRWHDAATKAHLRISGYNLFTYLHATGRVEIVRTIEHQTKINLLQPPAGFRSIYRLFPFPNASSHTYRTAAFRSIFGLLPLPSSAPHTSLHAGYRSFLSKLRQPDSAKP